MRPDYPNEGVPSIQTWEKACIISQQWAIDARQAAIKRKQWQHWIALALVLLMIMIVLLLALIIYT